MAHLLCLGPTECGKSTAMLSFVKRQKRATGRKVLVYARRDHARWNTVADFVTADRVAFLKIYWQNRNLLVVFDDAGATVGRNDPEMEACFAEGRHEGHTNIVIAQAATMLNPQIRRNCTMLRCFKQGKGDANLLAEEFIQEDLRNLFMLAEYEYMDCRKGFGKVTRDKERL